MKAVLFVLFASLLFASVLSECNVEPKCDNPMFKYHARFWVQLHYLDAAVEVENADSICANFKDGDLQCCDNAVYELIGTVFNVAKEEVQLTVDAMKKYAEQLEEIKAKYEEVRDKYVADEKVKELVSDILDAFDKFLDNIIGNWADCASAVLKYNLGLICLGCDPEWACYIQKVGTKWTLRLTEDTCNSMRGECGTFFNDFAVLAQDIADAVAEAAGIIPPLVHNPCGGDCGEYICKVLVAAQKTDLSVGGTISVDVSKRQLAPEYSFVSQLGHLPIDREILEGLDEIHAGIASMFGNKSNKVQERQLLDAGVQASVYVSGDDGYDTYKVGAESSLDTHISSANVLSSWLSYLF